ncbi:MAG: 4'-phosphopantetheinyl transferase superfamily protein [Thermodesulfobacteriota bacterium]
MNRPKRIYPVILSVQRQVQGLTGKERVRKLGYWARCALLESARLSDVTLTRIEKNESGAPTPLEGIYWSLSHKKTYVCAVVSHEPIGIDLEELRPRPDSLFLRITDVDEQRLSSEDRKILFFRYWTSKEAILKAEGDGLKGLSRCKIEEILDPCHLTARYSGKRWHIEHHYFNGHIASIVRNHAQVEWTLYDELPVDGNSLGL